MSETADRRPSDAPATLNARRLADCPVRRIRAEDTNRFVLLVDPHEAATGYVSVVEIFDVGGRTPPNIHRRAWESFFVLAGEGLAVCADRRWPIRRGDSLWVPPGVEHVIENTGSGRLYCLTTMVPDEDFAALIRAGVPACLDAEDFAVLGGY